MQAPSGNDTLRFVAPHTRPEPPAPYATRGVRHMGFTGTRDGMTREQLRTAVVLLRRWNTLETFRHGDDKGADTQLHTLALALTDAVPIGHPPANDIRRGFNAFAERYKPEDYLARDKTMAIFLGRLPRAVLLAAPKTAHEVVRSGTWSTVRYAKLARVTCVIINPNGAWLVEEGGEARGG